MAIATIYQGAGTPNAGRTVEFSLPNIDYRGQMVEFELLGHRREIDPSAGTRCAIAFTAGETALMPLGTHTATLSLLDGGSSYVFATVRVRVTDIESETGAGASVIARDYAIESLPGKLSRADLADALSDIEGPTAGSTQKDIRETLAALLAALKGVAAALLAGIILAGCAPALADTILWEDVPPDTQVDIQALRLAEETDPVFAEERPRLATTGDVQRAVADFADVRHMPDEMFEPCDMWYCEERITRANGLNTNGVVTATMEISLTSEGNPDAAFLYRGWTDPAGAAGQMFLFFGAQDWSSQDPDIITNSVWSYTSALGWGTTIVRGGDGGETNFSFQILSPDSRGQCDVTLTRLLSRSAGYPKVVSTNDLSAYVTTGGLAAAIAGSGVLDGCAPAYKVEMIPDRAKWHYLYHSYGWHSEYDLPWDEAAGAWVYAGEYGYTNMLSFRDGLWLDIHGDGTGMATNTIEADEGALFLPGHQGNFSRETVPTNHPPVYRDELSDYATVAYADAAKEEAIDEAESYADELFGGIVFPGPDTSRAAVADIAASYAAPGAYDYFRSAHSVAPTNTLIIYADGTATTTGDATLSTGSITAHGGAVAIYGGTGLTLLDTHYGTGIAEPYAGLLAAVVCPEVTELGYKALLGCERLTAITLPKCETVGTGRGNNGNFAVLGGTAAEELEFPVGRNICGYAFYGSTRLRRVHLPSATSIGTHAFEFCDSLELVDFGNTLSAVPDLAATSAFNSTPNDLAIVVPDALYESWITSGYWATVAASKHIYRHSDWMQTRGGGLPVGDFVTKSKKELHADGWTNIVWQNVYSNGWVFLRAYTNELSEAY